MGLLGYAGKDRGKNPRIEGYDIKRYSVNLYKVAIPFTGLGHCFTAKNIGQSG